MLAYLKKNIEEFVEENFTQLVHYQRLLQFEDNCFWMEEKIPDISVVGCRSNN